VISSSGLGTDHFGVENGQGSIRNQYWLRSSFSMLKETSLDIFQFLNREEGKAGPVRRVSIRKLLPVIFIAPKIIRHPL